VLTTANFFTPKQHIITSQTIVFIITPNLSHIMASGSGTSAKDFYEDEKHLMKLCDFLRSSEGPPVREAVEMDKRVNYIKGVWIATHFSR
jgi:hypothetical protein